MVFFPSYSFMEHIYEIYEQYFMTEEEECLVQQESMNEKEGILPEPLRAMRTAICRALSEWRSRRKRNRR
ncbi:hypothetical protein [Waltera sp.]|uniref:hypothetical protein n=1 Tax=Waltera sp. TaxID=2815806 RepID=UPI0039906DC7